jgi:hypothetical protein
MDKFNLICDLVVSEAMNIYDDADYAIVRDYVRAEVKKLFSNAYDKASGKE